MENKKTKLVGSWILTIIAVFFLVIALITNNAAVEALESNNAAKVFFGGTVMIILYALSAIADLLFALFPLIRSSKVLFDKKEKNVSGWLIFVVTLLILITILVLTIRLLV